jgi:hypothetical protein
MVANEFSRWSPSDENSFLFRGQEDKSWKLLPSIARIFERSPLNIVYDAEKEALDLFRRQAHESVKLSAFRNQEDPLEWWPHMQHYGAPTRLLDWTSSPYVAAYFASGGSEKTDGVIWFIEGAELWSRMDKAYHMGEITDPNQYIILSKEQIFDTKAKRRVFVAYKTYDDKRMLAQQGGYTFCLNPLADQGASIDKVFAGDRRLYGKYIIKGRLKLEFRRRLYSMNSAANSLFPGQDGIGRSIAEYLIFGRSISQVQGAAGKSAPRRPQGAKKPRRSRHPE